MKRFELIKRLRPSDVADDPRWVPLADCELSLVGEAMFRAYDGTVDCDPGDTVEKAQQELAAWFEGKHGAPVVSACLCCMEGSRPVCGIVVSEFVDLQLPLIAFVFTDPDFQRQGLAREAVQRSMNGILAEGHKLAYLVVTESNPALHLYESLGFTRCEIATAP